MSDDNNLSQYKVSATDWRESLRRNERNTRFVILLFILIYVLIGFIIDVYVNFDPKIPIETTAIELATFKIIPFITFIMLGVAVISILISLYFYKGLMLLGTEYHEVTSDTRDPIEARQLYNVVEEMKIAAGLHFMPKIYIIDAEYMNAFASGFSEKSAMVAITRGLLTKLDRDELEAVMAHELSHIRHEDIRLTLIIAILSNLMLIAIDLVFRSLFFGRDREGKGNNLVVIIMIARFLLPIITLLLVLYLSRTRELMADAGSVELMRSNEPLARALLKIHQDHTDNKEAYTRDYSNTPHEQIRREAYLYDPEYAGISTMSSINSLFSTHPSLEVRLKALGIEKPDITPKS